MSEKRGLPDPSSWSVTTDEGRCRFNCRTAKSAFLAGYELAHGFKLTEREREKLGEHFREWKSGEQD